MDLQPEQETIEPSIDQALIEVVKKVEDSVKLLLPSTKSSNDDNTGPEKQNEVPEAKIDNVTSAIGKDVKQEKILAAEIKTENQLA